MADRVSNMKLTHIIPGLCFNYIRAKGKAIPIQAWTGPEHSRRFRLPNSRKLAHRGGNVVSPMQWLPLVPGKYPWYSFLLGAESTPGPYCDQKDYVKEKSE
jgi:hypothetical protein